MKQMMKYVSATLMTLSLLAMTSTADTKKAATPTATVKSESTATTKSSDSPAKSELEKKEAVTIKPEATDPTFDVIMKTSGMTKEEFQRQISTPQHSSYRMLTGEQIPWQVISGGGGASSSASYSLVSVIGQTAVGPVSSSNYSINQGFLQNFGSAGCCDAAGDANNSSSVNIADATFLIARIFSGGPAPACCEEGDANGSGAINIGDVTFLIARIFAGGPAPVCGPAGMSCLEA